MTTKPRHEELREKFRYQLATGGCSEEWIEQTLTTFADATWDAALEAAATECARGRPSGGYVHGNPNDCADAVRALKKGTK